MGNGAMTRTRATIAEGMVDIYKVGLRDAFHMLHMLPLSEKKCGRSPLLSIPTRMPDSFPENGRKDYKSLIQGGSVVLPSEEAARGVCGFFACWR